MEIDAVKWRFCQAIACEKLDGLKCKVRQCQHPDMAEALRERREKLREVKHG